MFKLNKQYTTNYNGDGDDELNKERSNRTILEKKRRVIWYLWRVTIVESIFSIIQSALPTTVKRSVQSCNTHTHSHDEIVLFAIRCPAPNASAIFYGVRLPIFRSAGTSTSWNADGNTVITEVKTIISTHV